MSQSLPRACESIPSEFEKDDDWGSRDWGWFCVARIQNSPALVEQPTLDPNVILPVPPHLTFGYEEEKEYCPAVTQYKGSCSCDHGSEYSVALFFDCWSACVHLQILPQDPIYTRNPSHNWSRSLENIWKTWRASLQNGGFTKSMLTSQNAENVSFGLSAQSQSRLAVCCEFQVEAPMCRF